MAASAIGGAPASVTKRRGLPRNVAWLSNDAGKARRCLHDTRHIWSGSSASCSVRPKDALAHQGVERLILLEPLRRAGLLGPEPQHVMQPALSGHRALVRLSGRRPAVAGLDPIYTRLL